MAECIIIVPPDTPLANNAAKYNLKVELLKPHWKYGDITASIRLARILKLYHIDVAVIVQSKDMSIITLAHILYPSTKLVFYQQMQSGIDKSDIFHTWMYSNLTLWITLTKKMKLEVLEHTRMREERISVIPIGTDMHRFDPNLYDQLKSRQQFGIPPTELVIGVLGRLDPQKGQEEFIRAIPTLLTRQTDLHFVIVGDETPGLEGFEKSLINLSRKLGISNCVQFIPFTDAAPEFMSAIDIFVLPSHSETFGVVLVEAMAMGKAIVATHSGGVPEIITDSSTGLLVPPRDVPALAEALMRLLNNQELRLSLSSSARADALKRFDIAHCIDQLVLSFDAL